eukprot:6181234-Pleurochrysis_carterae.AAC.4
MTELQFCDSRNSTIHALRTAGRIGVAETTARKTQVRTVNMNQAMRYEFKTRTVILCRGVAYFSTLTAQRCLAWPTAHHTKPGTTRSHPVA